MGRLKGVGYIQWAKKNHCLHSIRLRHLSNYVRIPGDETKDKKNRQENKRKMSGVEIYACVHRYKITSTLWLLLRGDPQNETLRRALASKLDFLHAGITSTRLHRQVPRRTPAAFLRQRSWCPSCTCTILWLGFARRQWERRQWERRQSRRVACRGSRRLRRNRQANLYERTAESSSDGESDNGNGFLGEIGQHFFARLRWNLFDSLMSKLSQYIL